MNQTVRDQYSWTDKGVQRRIISHSGFRLDGLADILPRVRGASTFDIGCNRGHVSYDFMYYGASVVHGCDNNEDVIRHANELFADYRHIKAKFEVVDLSQGSQAVADAFPNMTYDVVAMLAVYHKLRRIMDLKNLLGVVDYFAKHCNRFFIWRGSREEMEEFEPTLTARRLRRVHYSEICEVKLPEYTEPVAQPAAIWAKTTATSVALAYVFSSAENILPLIT